MDIVDAIKRIPPITRYYIAGIFLISFCVTYRILSPYYLLMDFEKFFY